jgi:hypothetical protein
MVSLNHLHDAQLSWHLQMHDGRKVEKNSALIQSIRSAPFRLKLRTHVHPQPDPQHPHARHAKPLNV